MSNNNTNPSKPFQPINWPKTNTNTQLQQVKAAGISGKPSTAQPASPAGVSPTTQGQPKTLSNIQVTKTAISATQYQLTVAFNRDPTDPYYTHTVIHIQQGSNTPVQVGAGTTSPIKVIVNKSQTPTTVIAQAVGNWGQVPITSSPVQTVSLSDISPPPVTTISGNPGSGITGNFPANQVYASPASGGAGPLSVRGLVTADIPFLPASIITTGTLALTVGGTAANLSATGGAHQVLMQTSVGGAVTVAQLAASDLSNGINGTGAVVLTDSPIFTTKIQAPLYQVGGTALGLSRDSTTGYLCVGNGTLGDFSVGLLSSGLFATGRFEVRSSGVFSWSSTSDPTAAADTGISRDAAAGIAFGNGMADDISAYLAAGRVTLVQPANSGDIYKAKRQTDSSPAGNFLHFVNNAGSTDLLTVDVTGLCTAYNGIAVVDNGIPSEVGHANPISQSAAIPATTLYTPTKTGRYRISVYAQVGRAATTSSTLGPVTITYTDGTNAQVAQSVVVGCQDTTGARVTSTTTNTANAMLIGEIYIRALTGVAIQYAIGYASSGATTMLYDAQLTCEAM